jgi:hypothetical protein
MPNDLDPTIFARSARRRPDPNLDRFGLFGLFAMRKHFIPPKPGEDTAAGGGGDDTVAGGGGDDPDPGDDDTAGRLSRAESSRIIRDRDDNKQALRAIAEGLGLGVKWEPDPDKPGHRRPIIDGLDDLKEYRQAQRDDREGRFRKAGQWDKFKAELVQDHQNQTQALETRHAKRLTGRDGLIAKLAVDGPLKAALLEAGCMPSAVDAAAKLSREALKTEILEGDDGESVTLKITPLDAEGKPMLDGTSGKVADLKKFATKFLHDQPYFRDARHRPGPGASGYGSASHGGNGSSVVSDEAAAVQAADAMFGIKPAR